MHIMLSIAKNLLDDCLKFLDALNGLEYVPDNVRQAQKKFYDLLAIIKMDVKQEMEQSVGSVGGQRSIVEQREAKATMTHYLKDCTKRLSCQAMYIGEKRL